MSEKSDTIADFYHQLGLLVQSSFPLPDCLRRLAESLPGARARQMVDALREKISAGEKLADALRAQPAYFSDFHIRLISIGETTNTLGQILPAIAQECRFEQFLVSRAREIMAYPLFVLHMAALVFLGVSVFFMPTFQDTYGYMAQHGGTIPPFIAFSLRVSRLVNQFWPVLLGLQAVLLILTAWLYSGALRAHRTLMQLLDRLPGTARISRMLDAARICSLWRLFLERDLPMPDALRTTAGVLQRTDTREALQRVAEALERGGQLAALVEKEPALDSLIAFTLRYKPEAILATSLAELQAEYEERVLVMARDAAGLWTVIGLTAMTTAVLLMVLMVFVPVVRAHESLQLM